MEDEEHLHVHSCSMGASGWAEGQPEAQVPHCPGQSAKGGNCRCSNIWRAEQLFFGGVSPAHSLLWSSGDSPSSPPTNLYEHCPKGARGCAHLSLCPHCIQSDPGAGNHSCIGRVANSPKITERRNKGTEVWGHGRRWLMSCTSLMVASVLFKCLPVICNTHVCKTYVLQSISHTLKMWAARDKKAANFSCFLCEWENVRKA